jgi:hypothetical protein
VVAGSLLNVLQREDLLEGCSDCSRLKDSDCLQLAGSRCKGDGGRIACSVVDSFSRLAVDGGLFDMDIFEVLVRLFLGAGFVESCYAEGGELLD